MAPFYDALKFPFTLGQPEHQIKQFSGQLQKESTHLIIGVGTGKYASIVIKETHPKKVICVDISDKMLRLTQSKIDSEKHLFLNVDILEGLQHSPNTVYLHLPFILDCLTLEKLDQVLQKISTSNHSQIIVQDFNYSQSTFGKTRDLILHSFFSPILSLKRNYIPNIRQLFIDRGFKEDAVLIGTKTFTSFFSLIDNPQKQELKNQ